MRIAFSTRSARSSSPVKHLTGWRWALVVTAGSMVLFAGLLVLGVGVAAKLGVTVGGVATAPKTVSPAMSVAQAEPANGAGTPASTLQAESSAVTQASAQPSDATAATRAVKDNSAVCEAIVEHYRSLLGDLAKTKPVPLVSTVLSRLTATLKGQYNARAGAYNASLDAYQAAYTQETTANSCGLLVSPFDTLTKALVL